MKTTIPSLLLTIPLLFVSSALAQRQTFTVDPGSSAVNFSLGDVLHTVQGNFHVQSGSIDFDRSAPNMSGSVIVAADSGKSGNDTRDRKMSTEILNAPRFADVSFAPHSYQGAIAPTGDSTIQVTGIFTLHGTPHELTVPMHIVIVGTKCTVKAQFTIPYVKWGLKDPSTFILRVAKQVGIDLTLIGRLSPST